MKPTGVPSVSKSSLPGRPTKLTFPADREIQIDGVYQKHTIQVNKLPTCPFPPKG